MERDVYTSMSEKKIKKRLQKVMKKVIKDSMISVENIIKNLKDLKDL